MRRINSDIIINQVEKLCISANYYLEKDILLGLKDAIEKEESPLGKNILEEIVSNAELAKENQMPICQDTGMAVFFVDIGQDLCIEGKGITEAINEGVRKGYKEGYLRKSVVADPLNRVNTDDNTPAVIHYNMIKGDKIKITLAPKGFGSENMSALKMLKPSDGVEGVKEFIVDTVSKAGANPCPPIVVGVGIGGTMEKAAYLSKKALIRPINKRNKNVFYKDMEIDILERINKLGIGPQGLGGRITALAVNIEQFPTHIAGLPVAVNINCHVTRHKEILI